MALALTPGTNQRNDMTPEEKQAVYDEIDRVMSGDEPVTPELDAKIDEILKEDFSEEAAKFGIA